jgi:hypothetical protein
MQIELHTQSITNDSLDHDGTIPADRMREATAIYIEVALDALRAAYPDAEIDTAEGNGLTGFAVWDDDGDDADEGTRLAVENVLSGAYEDWCESIERRLSR